MQETGKQRKKNKTEVSLLPTFFLIIVKQKVTVPGQCLAGEQYVWSRRAALSINYTSLEQGSRIGLELGNWLRIVFYLDFSLTKAPCPAKKLLIYWWLVRVTLVVAWWLFAPKFWEVVGTYESLFCSKMNAASVVVTCEVVGTLNHYKMVEKNFELCALRGGEK